MTYVSPSLLASDFANLQREIESIPNADMLHVDVMDGHFVPNISLGIPVVQSLRKCTDKILDVHLMISHPQKYIAEFAKAGADYLTVHVESDCNVQECIDLVKENGVKVGLVVKPATPIEAVYPYLEQLDMVLIMTVEPGFGGQKMIASCLEKATQLQQELARRGLDILIEADGGIDASNAETVRNSGVNVLVAGSAVFRAEDRPAMINRLKGM